MDISSEGTGEPGALDFNALVTAIERGWREAFTALSEGDDLPPGQRYRLEGMMAAAEVLRPGVGDQLMTSMDAVYREVFGETLADTFGGDWRQFYPFPQIPAVMRRAPVYPSTAD